ncbi:MAG: bifunctional homocysteine S-methyltransferase/methylenetetrahydrofolate reductase [Anaerolineales bacterium]
MGSDLLARLAAGPPVLADGAMGTLLHGRGVALGACFDELSLSRPDLISSIHREYLVSGCQLLETNSFGANRFKLAAHGVQARVLEINSAAARLAREAAELAGRSVWIAGSVGPLGVRLAPFGRVSPEQASEAFREQIASLASGGVDLILLETHTDLEEIRLAILAARSVAPGIPVAAAVTFTRDDRTLLGDTPSQAALAMAQAGADVIGANCSGGPAQLLRVLPAMRQAVPGIPISVMPNAGWPEQVGGRIMSPAGPGYFADFGPAFVEAGASIVGGCCGTTPDHSAAMRLALEAPSRRSFVLPSAPVETAELVGEAPGPTGLASTFAAGRFAISVELDPPRGFTAHKLLAGAQLLGDAGADALHIADSPMARMRMSPWAACHLLQQDLGLESVLHFPTRGRSLLRVQGDLLAAHALGVRNVFVVMGDPTSVGDYPEAMDDFDLAPSGLIRLIKHEFNAGVDHSGADLGGSTSFFVGCALNPSASDIGRELRVLHRKVANGADFILTQPVFDPAALGLCLSRYGDLFGPLPIPILAGILPLASQRHADYLHNEVPGVQIPDPLRRRMSGRGPEEQAEGQRIAWELIEAVSQIARGIYLMPAFNRYDLAAALIEIVRERIPAVPARPG